MKKMLVFDMDGTIADLYGVKNWLSDLRNEKVDPYVNAKPLYNMEEMANVLNSVKKNGWKVVVTTWLAKDATKAYDKAVAKAKKEWLIKHNFPVDEIHCLKYGRTKANATRKKLNFRFLLMIIKKFVTVGHSEQQ